MGLSAVDLFCGCGGLTLGLAMGGFDVVAGVDSWQPAIDTYRANYPGHPAHCMDLSDEDAAVALLSRYRPFLVAGGPPCQDFSIAGGKLEGDRADMTVKYARTVTRLRPRAFIMENVPRAIKSAAYRQARLIFRRAGYGLSVQVIDAADIGVPQRRRRLIMVGMLGERDGFLDGPLDSLDTRVIGDREDEVGPRSVRSYLGEEIDFDHYYSHPRTYGRRAIFSVDEQAPTVRGVNRPCPASYRRHEGDCADPGTVSNLTSYQRARLQTFPRAYAWPEGQRAAVEQMIGNAVPVKLAAYVARHLYLYATGETVARPQAEVQEQGWLLAAE